MADGAESSRSNREFNLRPRKIKRARSWNKNWKQMMNTHRIETGIDCFFFFHNSYFFWDCSWLVCILLLLWRNSVLAYCYFYVCLLMLLRIPLFFHLNGFFDAFACSWVRVMEIERDVEWWEKCENVWSSLNCDCSDEFIDILRFNKI